MLLSTFVVAWVISVNQWLSDGYGWRTAIPCGIFGAILALIDWRACLGTVLGFVAMAVIGHLFIVGHVRFSPEYYKAMLIVASFGAAIGSSINVIILRRFIVGGVSLAISVIAFAVILIIN